MLALTMGKGDKIDIGNVTITYVRMSGSGKIVVGFEAPEEVQILRHNAVCKVAKTRKEVNDEIFT